MKMIQNILKFLLVVSLVLCLPSFSAANMSEVEFIRLCQKGSLAEIQAAIQEGANVNARDNNGSTPLHVAPSRDFRDSAPEVIQVLLDAGADVNAKDKGGLTPLHTAAWRNYNPEAVKVLLKAGADVNARGMLGWTPLHVAVQNDSPRMLEVVPAALLKAGADANAEDEYGRRPISYSNRNLIDTEAYQMLEAATN